ncbi:hypothetical protein PVK73_31780 [Bacillus thuringiensis]
MAYNFITNKLYPIDFNELKKMFLQHHLLSFDYQEEWITNWLELLQKADQDTYIKIKNNQHLSFKKLEIAQKQLIFPSFTFYFHFFIAGAHLFIEKTKPTIQNISLHQIQNQSFPLDWTPTDHWQKSVNNHKPILYIEFPFDTHEYLLIDGNHRLTAKIQTQQTSIPSYFISPQHIIKFSLLPASIDLTMYLFLIESSHFSKALSEHTYTHQHIFNSSFTHTAYKYMFQS